MPIERDRYIPDWKQFSLAIKSAAQWRCEHCGLLCRKTGESAVEFSDRVGIPLGCVNIWGSVLTTAHLDQNPANNHPDNLRALCVKCHLAHDRRFLFHNRYLKRERQGQMNLFLDLAGKGEDPSRVQPNILVGEFFASCDGG